MQLNELQHFIAIVEFGNFSKAAANIYVSQPNLSKSIKKLETKLNVQLFRRSTKTLELTDAGQIVYEQALKVIESTDELTAKLDLLTHSPTGEIKIGVPPVIGTLFFPKIATEFGKLYPNITLELVEHGAKKIEQFIEEGKVDIGLVVLPVNQHHFDTVPYINEAFYLFTSDTHPLANEEIVDVLQLKNENFIIFNQDFALHHLIIHYCEQAGFSPNITYESSQWDLIIELVRANLGITLLPQSIYHKMTPDNVKKTALHHPPLWRLGIITKKDRYQSFATRALLDYFNSNERKHPKDDSL